MATISLIRAQTVINMERSGNGNTYYVPCKVNGLPLKMLFDTGADDVSLSLSEAIFMVKNGYLSENDLGRTTYYSIANGDAVEGLEVNLREIEIGGLKLRNVKASIIKSLSAPLLLGQSAIQKLGPIQINGNKLIILNGASNKDDQGYYMEAFQYNEANEFDKAITSCKRGISVATSDEIKAALYYELGNAYAGKKDLENAAEAYREALKYELRSIVAYNLGVTYFEAEKNDPAYNAFKHCLNIMETYKDEYRKSTEAACYSYMSEIDRQKGRLYDAERNAKKSIDLEPYSQTYFTLGKVYGEKQDYKKLVYYFELGIAFEPDRFSNIKYYSEIGGRCLFFLTDDQSYIEKGLIHLEKAINIWDNTVARYGRSIANTELIQCAYYSALPLAYFYSLVGETTLAEKYLNKAIEIRGKDIPPDTKMEDKISEGLNNPNPYKSKNVLTINLESYNLQVEIETHIYKLTKIEISDNYTKLYKRAIPKMAMTYICSDKEEFIEDADTGKKYYLDISTIAICPSKTILYNEEPVDFVETYPALDKKTKYIYICSGSAYYGKKQRLKVR